MQYVFVYFLIDYVEEIYALVLTPLMPSAAPISISCFIPLKQTIVSKASWRM